MYACAWKHKMVTVKLCMTFSEIYTVFVCGSLSLFSYRKKIDFYENAGAADELIFIEPKIMLNSFDVLKKLS